MQEYYRKLRRFWGAVWTLAAVSALLCLAAGPAGAEPWDRNTLKVGLLEQPKTVNVWLASDAWSSRILSLVYLPLYEHEPKSLRLAPFLAAGEPEAGANKKTYLIKLRPGKWSDGSEFTAEDVVFTGEIIQKFQIPRFRSKWREVKKIEAVDKHTVRFVLSKPKATFLTRTLTTPIVQKKQWEPLVKKALKTKKPLASLLQIPMTRPVGTGPFVLEKWRKGVFLHLVKNQHFLAQGQTIAGLKLGPYAEGLICKVYGTSDAAVLALRTGEIDMYWNSIQPGYLAEVKREPHVKIFTNKKSALYYLGFNTRKAPFNDPAFRKAVAYLVDKEYIVRRILQGAGEPMYSVVPPGNAFFHKPNCTKYGEGLTREQRVKKAFDILSKAGYTWEEPPVNQAGELQEAEGLKLPNGQPMEEFSILTPPADYDPNRAMSGIMVQEWLRRLGIPVFARPMSFGALLAKVKVRRDFDCFVLGYGRLSLDPDYMRAFFHGSQDKRRGWNMSGYHNKAYDKLATKQSNLMDPEERRVVVHHMQEILMRDVPYIPLYNPILQEGVRTDRFVGWVPMVEGIGNVWSFCRVHRVDGPANGEAAK